MNNLDLVRGLHPEMQPDAVPKQCEGYHVARIPCCFLLQDERGEHFLKLNETSVLIWELCDGETSVDDMLELLKESFPEAANEMKKDLNRVLDELKEEGVISISGI